MVIHRYSPLFLQLVNDNFRDIKITMLTLVSIMTLDNASGFYIPLIQENSYLALFFFTFMLLVSVSSAAVFQLCAPI